MSDIDEMKWKYSRLRKLTVSSNDSGLLFAISVDRSVRTQARKRPKMKRGI